MCWKSRVAAIDIYLVWRGLHWQWRRHFHLHRMNFILLAFINVLSLNWTLVRPTIDEGLKGGGCCNRPEPPLPGLRNHMAAAATSPDGQGLKSSKLGMATAGLKLECIGTMRHEDGPAKACLFCCSSNLIFSSCATPSPRCGIFFFLCCFVDLPFFPSWVIILARILQMLQ